MTPVIKLATMMLKVMIKDFIFFLCNMLELV